MMPNLPPEQLAAIREAAEKALERYPSPDQDWQKWEYTSDAGEPQGEWFISNGGRGNLFTVGGLGRVAGTVIYSEGLEADAAYIVAAQPANVLALLDDRDALAERVRELEAERRLTPTAFQYRLHLAQMAAQGAAERAAIYDRARDEAEARATAAEAERDAMRAALVELVDEFGGSIEQYHKIGPDFTHKDGTEVFHVGVVLDRAELIERARAALTPKPQEKPDA